MKQIIETERLLLREMNEEDAPFMFDLLNSPGWLEFIGDRKINTLDDARNHINQKYISMYEKFGFGLWLVENKEDGISIGTCGLIKRPQLDDVDIGFAFMQEFTGMGYAYEAASATMKYGKERLNIDKIVAITVIENKRSIKLLNKLGLKFAGNAGFPDDEECILFEPSER